MKISRFVLILVLMEYALRESDSTLSMLFDRYGLNPCFNGICSASVLSFGLFRLVSKVLILVLMEYALRANQISAIKEVANVLILVLMEYALRDVIEFFNKEGFAKGLNPCFNGICSASIY